MSVAGLFEELFEDVTEVAAAFLGFRVRGVGLEDEHFDCFAAHFELLCWKGGAEEGSFGYLDVRLLGQGSGDPGSVDVA